MNTKMEENIKNGLDFNTVDYSADGTALRIIDQTLLPGKIKFLEIRAKEDIREAIYMLRVRGAPAIGVAAAIGLQVAAQDICARCGDDTDAYFDELHETADYLEACLLIHI